MDPENKLELKFDCFFRSYDNGQIPFLKRWQKNSYLKLHNANTIEDVERVLNEDRNPECAADCYLVLEKVKEKKGNLLFTLRVVPGHGSDAIKYNHPTSYHQYKIVPKIKIKQNN